MKRFYKKAEVAPGAGGHGVVLDGRLVKTAGKHDLIVPSLALATAVAAEWEAQQGEIRRDAMPLTRLAGATIDRSAAQREAVVRQVAAWSAVSEKSSCPATTIVKASRPAAGWLAGMTPVVTTSGVA